MLHPADKSRPKLPQGPLVLAATADAKLSLLRLGNIDEVVPARYEHSSDPCAETVYFCRYARFQASTWAFLGCSGRFGYLNRFQHLKSGQGPD